MSLQSQDISILHSVTLVLWIKIIGVFWACANSSGVRVSHDNKARKWREIHQRWLDQRQLGITNGPIIATTIPWAGQAIPRLGAVHTRVDIVHVSSPDITQVDKVQTSPP